MCSVLGRAHCIIFFFFLPSSLALSQGASQSLEFEEEEDSLFLTFALPSTIQLHSFFLSSRLWLSSSVLVLLPDSDNNAPRVLSRPFVSSDLMLFFLPVTYVTLVDCCDLHWFDFSSFFVLSSLSLYCLVLSLSSDLFLSDFEILSSLDLLPPFLSFSSLDPSLLLVLSRLWYFLLPGRSPPVSSPSLFLVSFTCSLSFAWLIATRTWITT